MVTPGNESFEEFPLLSEDPIEDKPPYVETRPHRVVNGTVVLLTPEELEERAKEEAAWEAQAKKRGAIDEIMRLEYELFNKIRLSPRFLRELALGKLPPHILKEFQETEALIESLRLIVQEETAKENLQL